MSNLLGGFGETQNATEEIQAISDIVKPKVEEMTNKTYEVYKAIKYREQIVAGTNFLIKVHVGGVNYIHLMVFQALPCYGGGIKLSGVQAHKTEEDPLIPF